MGECILQMRNITVEFPGVKALKSVDFSANRGEVHVLLGENGAGKSTIMKVLAGVNTNYTGEVILRGEVIRCRDVEEQRCRGISMIFQELNLLGNLTVAENIYMQHYPKTKFGQVNWAKMYQDTRALLDSIDSGVSERALVSSLSVGEMQMVEIAKAICFHADVIIMDEPTSALTDKEVNALYRIIDRLKENGIVIIFISHRLEEIMRVADQITILRDGAYITTKRAQDTTIDEVIRLMVDRELPEYFPRVQPVTGDVLLEAKHICQKKRLKDVSFCARAGEITGFYGLMGAGRTELMRAVFGADRIDSGEIFVCGKQKSIHSCADATESRIALLTEDRKSQGLILNFSVRSNISLTNLRKVMRKSGIVRKLELENVEQLSKSVRVKTPSIEQSVGYLSGGNQQKVVIAKWLNTEADIFIFDEPTRGIDVGAKIEIYNLMNHLKQQGKAIIMVSSELPECMGISDRLYVMHEGVVTAELTEVTKYTDKDILKFATGTAHREEGQNES